MYNPETGEYETLTVTDKEMLRYVYQFCKQFETVLNQIAQSPLARMSPGMPKSFRVNNEEEDGSA